MGPMRGGNDSGAFSRQIMDLSTLHAVELGPSKRTELCGCLIFFGTTGEKWESIGYLGAARLTPVQIYSRYTVTGGRVPFFVQTTSDQRPPHLERPTRTPTPGRRRCGWDSPWEERKNRRKRPTWNLKTY